jgi:ATP-dependent DNA helicase RecG
VRQFARRLEVVSPGGFPPGITSRQRPDFTGTDDYQVSLTLQGEIQDLQFLRFIEQVGRERLATFTTADFLVVDLAHREQPVLLDLKPRLSALVEPGIIETVGRGKGTRYILSRSFYGFIGKRDVYTRKKGLDRETNKALLLKHIRDNRKDGVQLNELSEVLPALPRQQVQALLRELQSDKQIHVVGKTKGARWFPGPGAGTSI